MIKCLNLFEFFLLILNLKKKQLFITLVYFNYAIITLIDVTKFFFSFFGVMVKLSQKFLDTFTFKYYLKTIKSDVVILLLIRIAYLQNISFMRKTLCKKKSVNIS